MTPRRKASSAQDEVAAVVDAETRRLSSLRTQLLEAHPFWGYLLLQVRLVPAPALPAFAATDCVRHIWWNPLLTRHLTPAQLGFVLAHEVGHQVLASEDRRRGRKHNLWNCATDYAINRIVARIQRPGGAGEPLYDKPEGLIPGLGDVRILDDPQYEGMIAEAIYERLAADGLPDAETVTLALPGDGAALPVLDHGGGIDVHLPAGLGEAHREELRERVAAAVETWRQMGERGDLPAEVARRLALGRGRVPWQRVFRQFVSQALALDEYTLTRPNRRYAVEDFIVPGLRSEKVGHVVVALDTSASMGEEELAAVAPEILRLAEQVEEATLIVADAEVHAVVPLELLEEYVRRGRFEGGGGTDHRPVFAYLAEHGTRPDVFVGLTDLASAFPERRPGFPVLWVVPPDHGEAPWGKVLVVDADTA